MPTSEIRRAFLKRNLKAQVVLFIISSALLLFSISCDRQAPTTNGIAVTNKSANAASPAFPREASDVTVKVPGGRFMMGDANEVDAPVHEVAVSSFYIDKYLVTQEQYQRLMHSNPSRWKGEKNPV